MVIADILVFRVSCMAQDACDSVSGFGVSVELGYEYRQVSSHLLGVCAEKVEMARVKPGGYRLEGDVVFKVLDRLCQDLGVFC
ncbi:hypothetical protein DSECCO2_589860 [anaerobic digester metagenome]